MKLQWIEDPGHAWLLAPLATVQTAIEEGVTITHSWRSQAGAYLEEDCDAPAFLAWLHQTKRSFTIPANAIYVDDFERDKIEPLALRPLPR